jgi:hypothetical protein
VGVPCEHTGGRPLGPPGITSCPGGDGGHTVLDDANAAFSEAAGSAPAAPAAPGTRGQHLVRAPCTRLQPAAAACGGVTMTETTAAGRSRG